MILLSLMLASAPEQTPSECSTVPPGFDAFFVAVGHGCGNEEAGRREAYADAHARLGAQVCAGLDPVSCGLARQQIQDWTNPVRLDRRCWCAVAVVDRAVLDPARQYHALEQAAAAVAEEASARLAALGLHGVHLPEVVWREDGCVARELEPARLFFRAGLHDLTLGEAPELPILRLEAVVAGHGQQVFPTLYSPDGATVLAAFSPISVGPGLFRVDTARRCVPLGDLGLDSPSRRGSTGLSVSLEVETRGGLLYVGETIQPVFTTNQPAQVRLYAVEPDGVTYFVPMPPGWPGTLQGTRALGDDLRVVAPPTPGDERLVAVATPEALARPADDGFCRLALPLHTRSLPPEAAVATVSYHVAPAPGVPPTPPEDLSSVPICR